MAKEVTKEEIDAMRRRMKGWFPRFYLHDGYGAKPLGGVTRGYWFVQNAINKAVDLMVAAGYDREGIRVKHTRQGAVIMTSTLGRAYVLSYPVIPGKPFFFSGPDDLGR